MNDGASDAHVSAASRACIVERAVAALALTSAVWLLCNLVAFDYGRDQGIYAVVARGWLQGQAPYRDVWDFKPPGIFVVFALAQTLFGSSMHAVRVLEALGFASLIWAFAIFSRRHLGSSLPGIGGGMFAVLAHVQLEFWNTAQPSSFAAVALAWALVCATYEPPAARRGPSVSIAWLAAGALYGFAALLKPPLGGGILVSAAVLALRQRRQATPERRVRAILRPLSFLAAGALLPVMVVVAYFAVVGALGDMYDALFVFAPHYTALGLRDASFAALVMRAVREWLGNFSVVNVVGLLLLLGFGAGGERGREGALHVFGVICAVLFGVALQAKFFAYHYSAALALTSLLAGWGFWGLWLRMRMRPYSAMVVGALVLASVGLTVQAPTYAGDGKSLWTRCSLRLSAWLNADTREMTSDRLYRLAEVDPAMNRHVAEWLKQATPLDATVFIWGFEPVIYELADRRPASRYVYNVPQRVDWAQRQTRPMLIAELQRALPAAVVVEHGDRFPWVTGDERDSAEVLQEFPELGVFLSTQYERAGSIGRFDLYRRRNPPASHGQV
jgi:hypothetical protein